MNLSTYFTDLARYHVWATQRLLSGPLAPLSDDEWHRDCGLFFRSVHRTVNHLLLTDNIWCGRFAEGVSLRAPLDAELHADRSALVADLQAAVQRWPRWVPTVTPERYGGELTYTRTNGEAVRIPFATALGHVFNHATHHRGQISAALTGMGYPGPELDWVTLLQQESKVA